MEMLGSSLEATVTIPELLVSPMLGHGKMEELEMVWSAATEIQSIAIDTHCKGL